MPARICGLFALVAALLAAPAPAADASRRELHVYTWSGYFEHGLTRDFEERFDCDVVFDYFDTNEAMLEHLDRVGLEAYDIVIPSSYAMLVMKRRGMLAPIDHARIPNLKHIDPEYRILSPDPEMAHSTPFTRTIAGVTYNAKRLGRLEPSWDVFSRTDLRGRMLLLRDMRQTMGAALKYLGYSLNSVDDGELAEAAAQLRKWRANIAAFKVDEFHSDLAANTVDVVHCYSGDVGFLVLKDPGFVFHIPEEGSAITTDELVILAGSPAKDLAHAFINHLYDPANAAQNMIDTSFYMPIPEAIDMLPETLRTSSLFDVGDDVFARCELIRDLGRDTAKYEAIWREFSEP